MSNHTKKQEEKRPELWKLGILFNFVMLFSMTAGQKPIQRAIDAISDKHELLATKKSLRQA